MEMEFDSGTFTFGNGEVLPFGRATVKWSDAQTATPIVGLPKIQQSPDEFSFAPERIVLSSIAVHMITVLIPREWRRRGRKMRRRARRSRH